MFINQLVVVVVILKKRRWANFCLRLVKISLSDFLHAFARLVLSFSVPGKNAFVAGVKEVQTVIESRL